MRIDISALGIPTMKGSQLIFDVKYLPPAKRAELESFCKDQEVCTLRFSNSTPKKTRSYKQLKMWFAMVEDILKFYREPVNEDNKMAISEYLKENYLPTQHVTINGKDLQVPKSISDVAEVPKDIFSHAIDRILTDYRAEGVAFRKDIAEIWGRDQ
jgi:hypothetical protein